MPTEPSALLCEALEPVLVPIGFQRGQGTAQVIFCAGYDALSSAYPRLPQAGKQRAGVGACIDLVVELMGAEVQRVDLEGQSLAATLVEVGEPAVGASVADLTDLALVDAITRVQRALMILFSSPGPAM